MEKQQQSKNLLNRIKNRTIVEQPKLIFIEFNLPTVHTTKLYSI